MNTTNTGYTHPLIPGVSFVIAAAVLLFGAWHSARGILAATGGVFVYGLDDPYIHLAIARTIIEHGVYGVTPHAVSFASSSLLWPMLLAGAGYVTGALDALPLVFNLLAALGSLWMIEAMGRREGIGVAGRFTVQMCFLLLTPVLPLVYGGMEHTLHLFSVLLVLYLVPGGMRTMSPARVVAIAAAVFLSVAVRYESVFLAIALGVLFLRHREWQATLAVLAAAALPVVGSGLVMMAHGGSFLSNSLLVKGPPLDSTILLDPIGFLYYYLLWPENQAVHWREMSLAVLLIGVLFCLQGEGSGRRFRPLIHAMLLFIALHILTVRFDHFSRYTGYLVGAGLVVALMGLFARLAEISGVRDARWQRHATVPLLLVGAITLWPLLMNGMSQTRHVPTASRNIHEQQYQLGRFVRQYYRGAAVALNDLGAMTYYGYARPVDLAGLAEHRVAIARRDRVFNTDSIRAVASEHGARIAIVYPDWFPAPWSIPEEWVAVEDWLLQDNLVCGGDTVRFYGVNSHEARLLRDHLRDFAPQLPPRVGVRQLPETDVPVSTPAEEGTGP